MTFVYVSNADSGTLSVLRLDGASGELQVLQTVQAGAKVMPMALSPDRRFLYVARRGEPLAVLTLAIDAASGHLALAGEAPLPDSMAYLATDRSGRFHFTASYGGNVVAVGRIGSDGIAQAAHQVLPTPPHAHAILPSPSGRHVHATSLGGDVVLRFGFDAEQGRLQPEGAAFVGRAGSGPRHLVFHPDGRHAYLLNELDASVDVLAVNAASGALSSLQTLSVLPPGFAGKPWAADLHLTPDGRFLYTSERSSSTLAVFAVENSGSRLAARGHVDTETEPRGFGLTRDGRHLIAAGQASHHVSSYAIDAASGALTVRSRCAVGQGPNWVETLSV